jgi:putative DNA methylase
MNVAHRKKLIEVALPLPEINDASAYDKMPGIGPHPKGIHHWWARLPLPTARAVLFASVVTDPSDDPAWKDKPEADQNAERERLFGIVRRMMQKRLHEHPEIYAEARAEMLKHCDGKLPFVFDPFAGGGSIPLEANRLGFEAHAGDLNPVAVLLNKCNLEIAPRWAGHPPVNPEARSRIGGKEPWPGTHGLAEDVRYYGRVIRERAMSKIGHLYPKVKLPKEYGGEETNVIAWIWARTIKCSNPACGAPAPLIRSFWLARKKPIFVHVRPVLDRINKTAEFIVVNGDRPEKETTSGKGARCLFCDTFFKKAEVRDLSVRHGVGTIPLAVVADGPRGRVYLPSTSADINNISSPFVDQVDQPMTNDRRWFSPPLYGMPNFTDLFTPRQLTAMVTFSDLVKEISEDVLRDAENADLLADAATAYASAVTTFLALAVDRCADFNNALCRWKPSGQQTMQLFARQAIPMVWDFTEPNIMGEKAVCWATAVSIEADAIGTVAVDGEKACSAQQIDAAMGINGLQNLLISTDPPYYDNIGYAALSDFFYVWLRRTVGGLYPDLFGTILVPKMAELTASPERFEGDRAKAKEHFESGFRKSFTALRDKMDLRFPLTVYYAFKQDDEQVGGDDTERNGSVDLTTGWETLLEALISSGFQITATWPVRASQKWRMVSMGTNALASYIVLACRPRSTDAPQCGRRDFINELKRDLPISLRHLQQGNVAPVDFAQAAIGPGMAIYSKYSRILESSGQAMTVRTALGLINQMLTEVLSEQEDEFDNNTRWALAWFEQKGFAEGEFGEAELLSKAKVTSVNGLVQAGILSSKAGKVRLLRSDELPASWDPVTDSRIPVWEMTHHLIRIYHVEQKGELATAEMLRKLSSYGEMARDLAYRLFSVCERKKLSQEAQGYNALVLAWPEISRLTQEKLTEKLKQTSWI